MSETIQLVHETSRLLATSRITLAQAPGARLPFAAGSDTVLTDHIGLGAGRLQTASLTQDGVEITRELFRPNDSPAIACRLLLHNRSDKPISVTSVTPLDFTELHLGECPVAAWNYLRAPRKKNDMPACIRLGDAGPAVWDAARGTPETGGAIQAEATEPPRRFVSSELTALFTTDMSVVVGVLPADRQLVQSVLSLSQDRTRLESFHVDCLGDGQQLLPGARFEGQWVMACFGGDVHETIGVYTRALAEVQPPRQRRRRPPTVWCSWYYYGDGFTQRECEQNLAEIESNSLPIDVFQLDECWDLHWGDWQANPDWPDLPGIARRIRGLGMEAGIWTCPVLAESRSRTRYAHPDWLLRDDQGRPITFSMNGMQNLVLDPTVPEVLDFISGIYRDLRQQGYTYFKLDFMRAVAEPGGVFADPTCNRADAFRMALAAVRRGAGEDAYVNVCGGFYGPALGLADAQRSGSDVKSVWPQAPAGEAGGGYGPFTIKQNTLRYWMNELWHIDPDALMVRRRSEPARGESLSLGLLDDEEALTCALNQYLGGGIVCFSENLAEIEADRLLLLRHCAPSINCAAVPRDLSRGERFPAVFCTRVRPAAKGLASWHTISVVNWHDEPRTFHVTLDEGLLGQSVAAAQPIWLSRFRSGTSQQVEAGAQIDIGPIAPHGCEVVKVQTVAPDEPVLLHTDGHFSMGGTEITSWSATNDGLELTVDWPWQTSLSLQVQAPVGYRFADGCALRLDVEPRTMSRRLLLPYSAV